MQEGPEKLNPDTTGLTDDGESANRREQLRLAKRRQRAREKRRGMATYTLRLPHRLAEKLKAGMKQEDFAAALHALVDRQVLCIDDYENLRLISWNRAGRFVSRAEAFQLYESNWRHVDPKGMSVDERDLIEQLAQEHGNGVINA